MSSWICRHSHVHMSQGEHVWLKPLCRNEALCQPSSAKLLLAISHVLQVFLFPFPCSCLPFCTFTQQHYSASYFNSLVPVLSCRCLEVNRHLLQPCHMCSVTSRLWEEIFVGFVSLLTSPVYRPNEHLFPPALAPIWDYARLREIFLYFSTHPSTVPSVQWK